MKKTIMQTELAASAKYIGILKIKDTFLSDLFFRFNYIKLFNILNSIKKNSL